jgi:hypothetical protein
MRLRVLTQLQASNQTIDCFSGPLNAPEARVLGLVSPEKGTKGSSQIDVKISLKGRQPNKQSAGWVRTHYLSVPFSAPLESCERYMHLHPRYQTERLFWTSDR